MSAQPRTMLPSSPPAAEAIAQYACVYIDTGELKTTDDATTDRPVGFAFDEYASGDATAVVTSGQFKAIVNGSGNAVAIGDNLTCGDNGILVKDDGTSNQYVVAVALEASSTAAAEIDVMILPNKEANP